MGIGRIKNSYNGIASIIAQSPSNIKITKIFPSDFGLITALKSYAFYSCNYLTDVKMSKKIGGVLGTGCFYYCTSLLSIDLENSSILGLGLYAFAYCSSLLSIKFPTTVLYTMTTNPTSLSQSPFYNCNALKTIDVNAECVTIRPYSFYIGASSTLEGIYIRATTPPTLSATTAFDNTNNCPIYVPYSADHSILTAYQGATNWSSLTARLTEYEF